MTLALGLTVVLSLSWVVLSQVKEFIVIFGQSVIRRGVWCIVVVARLHDLERFWWCTAVHRGGRVNRNIDGVRGGAGRGRSDRRTKSGCHSEKLFSGFLISWLMWGMPLGTCRSVNV